MHLNVPVPEIPAVVPWWEIVGALGPLAILAAAVLTLLLGWMTLRQRTRADHDSLAQRNLADSRSEWWSRAQWALDASLSQDKARATMGVSVLRVLALSDLAEDEELRILDIAWQDSSEDVDSDLPVADNGDSAKDEEVDSE